MCFAVPCEEYKANAVLARAMDRIFILHADHEQNASTSTVRLAGSSGANPFACIAAGCASLWGPAHGGANEAALKMLAEIGRVERIPEYIKRAKDKNDSFRLMGFGHRVYKNYDPRAKIMQKTCHEVLNELGIKDDPLLDVALELERIALSDDYFIEKKLYPNIDFYSGITLKAMGFPTAMFTVLFAVARTVGWIAQWKEMIEDPDQKIGRPRQLYTGAPRRDYHADLTPEIGGLRHGQSPAPIRTWIRLPCRVASTISAARALGEALPDFHDRIEPGERLDLAPALRAVGQQRRQRVGQVFWRAVPLQELRHDVLADDQIGQDDRGHLDHKPRDRFVEQRIPCRRSPSARRPAPVPA